MVKTLPSNAGGVGLIPHLRAKILHASWPKSQNMKQKQNVTNSIKTLKNGPLKKNFFFLMKEEIEDSIGRWEK